MQTSVAAEQQQNGALSSSSSTSPSPLSKAPPPSDRALPASSSIQITAPKDVLEARITAFIQRKQEENNKSNLEEFFRIREPSQDGCARVDTATISRAPLIKRTRIENLRGPLDSSNPRRGQIAEAAEQRLTNIENFLDVHTGKMSVSRNPVDVYDRIKLLEDRILAVEQVLLIHELWKWKKEHSEFVEQHIGTMQEDPSLQYPSALLLRPDENVTIPESIAFPTQTAANSVPAEAAVAEEAPEKVEERISALKRALQAKAEEAKRRKLAK